MINQLSAALWLVAGLVFLPFVPCHSPSEFNEGADSYVVTAEGQWEKLWENPKLMVWQRWLTLNHERKIRQRKCQMMLRASMKDIVGLIGNHRRATEWMSMVDTVELLGRSGNIWFTLAHYRMPWPLRDKMLSSRLELSTMFDSHMSIIDIESDNSRIKGRGQVNDFGSFHGRWVVVELGSELCFTEFTAYSTSIPLFPRWLQDPIVDRAFLNTMEQFVAVVHDKKQVKQR
jgi:hypothetical protein